MCHLCELQLSVFSYLRILDWAEAKEAKILWNYLCLWSSSCQSTLEMLVIMSSLTRFFSLAQRKCSDEQLGPHLSRMHNQTSAVMWTMLNYVKFKPWAELRVSVSVNNSRLEANPLSKCLNFWRVTCRWEYRPFGLEPPFFLLLLLLVFGLFSMCSTRTKESPTAQWLLAIPVISLSLKDVWPKKRI